MERTEEYEKSGYCNRRSIHESILCEKMQNGMKWTVEGYSETGAQRERERSVPGTEDGRACGCGGKQCSLSVPQSKEEKS